MSSTELHQNATEQYQLLLAAIARHRNDRGALIPILHEAQEIFGYLPLEVQRTISEELSIPLAEIFGVVSFYSQFSIYPKGKYRINVCMGTAFHRYRRMYGRRQILSGCLQMHRGLRACSCSNC